MRSIGLIAGSSLLLAGCVGQGAIRVDQACGTITFDNPNPTVSVLSQLSEPFDPLGLAPIDYSQTTSLLWTTDGTAVPDGTITSVYAEAFPFELGSDDPVEITFEPSSETPANQISNLSTLSGLIAPVQKFVGTDAWLASHSYDSDYSSPEDAPLPMPLAVLASCGASLLAEDGTAVQLVDTTNQLEDASMAIAYPGLVSDVSAIEFDGYEASVTWQLNGQAVLPDVVGVIPWLTGYEDSIIGDLPAATEVERFWAAYSAHSYAQAMHEEGPGPAFEYQQAGNQLTVENFSFANYFSADGYRKLWQTVLQNGSLGTLTHYYVYSLAVDESQNLSYTFLKVEPLAADNDALFTVEEFEPGDTAEEVARVILPSEAQISDVKINGLTSEQLVGDDAEVLAAFGKFSGAEEVIGMPSGLLIAANAEAQYFSRPNPSFGNAATELISGINGDPQNGPPPSAFFPASTGPSRSAAVEDATLGGLLLRAGIAAIPEGVRTIENVTDLSFTITPTSRYLKFDYALAVTEQGDFDGDSWGGDVRSYPDGLGIFTKGSTDLWAQQQNCAAVPTTSSYMTMRTAGIVPLQNSKTALPLAKKNHTDLLAPTLSEGYVANPDQIVDPDAAESGEGFIAPPELAYLVANGMANLRFATTVMTCVIDLKAAFESQTQVDIGIAVADFNDSAVPPALFIASGSVRFDETPVAVTEEVFAELTGANSAPNPYTGPIVQTVNPNPVVAGQQVLVTGLNLQSVSEVSIAGVATGVSNQTATEFRFTVPAGSKTGTVDVIVQSSFGALTLQGGLTVLAAGSADSSAGVKASIKRISGSTAKIYAGNVVAAGKVSFVLNGKEVAWLNAKNSSDRRVRLGTQGPLTGVAYMVRTLKLAEGKNVLEIYVEGKRVKRVAYTR